MNLKFMFEVTYVELNFKSLFDSIDVSIFFYIDMI